MAIPDRNWIIIASCILTALSQLKHRIAELSVHRVEHILERKYRYFYYIIGNFFSTNCTGYACVSYHGAKYTTQPLVMPQCLSEAATRVNCLTVFPNRPTVIYFQSSALLLTENSRRVTNHLKCYIQVISHHTTSSASGQSDLSTFTSLCHMTNWGGGFRAWGEPATKQKMKMYPT